MGLLIGAAFMTDTCSLLRPWHDSFNNSYQTPEVLASEVKCSGIWPHDADYDVQEIPRTFTATEVMYVDGTSLPEGVEPMIGDFIEPSNGITRTIRRVNHWAQGPGVTFELQVTRNADPTGKRGLAPIDLLSP